MHKLLVIVLGLLVVGCQSMTVERHPEGPVPLSVRVDDAAFWLEEWARVRGLPEDQLVTTLKARELEYNRDRDTRTRLRLALLLAEGPAPIRDQTRALDLLKAMDATEASSSALALAALLEQVISEQRWAADRIQTLKADLKQSQVRVEELERQLQELTNIEQSIQQRETPGDRKEKE